MLTSRLPTQACGFPAPPHSCIELWCSQERSESPYLASAAGLHFRQRGDRIQWPGDELPHSRREAAPTATERFACR